MDGFGHVFEHVVDLFLKPTGKHLIGLVEHEQLYGVEAQGSALDHVVDTPRSAHHHMHTVLEGADIVTNGGTTHASVDLDVHEVAQGADHFLDLQGKLSVSGFVRDHKVSFGQDYYRIVKMDSRIG